LYDAQKQLLALPVLLAEISADKKAESLSTGSTYGDYTFQGAYIYRLTLENGFQLLGRITHYADDQAFLKSGYYFGGSDDSIDRVGYVGNTLVTFSPDQLQLHAWPGLEKQGVVAYPAVKEQNYAGGGYSEGSGGIMVSPAMPPTVRGK